MLPSSFVYLLRSHVKTMPTSVAPSRYERTVEVIEEKTGTAKLYTTNSQPPTTAKQGQEKLPQKTINT